MQRTVPRGAACGSRPGCQLPQQRAVAAPPAPTISALRSSIVARASAEKPGEEEQDLVTRWVGKIFGKAAVEDRTPFGLKRMDWDQVGADSRDSSVQCLL